MRNLSRVLLAFFFICLALPVQAAITDLVITEIMYNLEGTDDPQEWVEIFNRGTKSLILIGGRGPGSWRFYDGSNHLLNIETLTISPGQHIVLADDAQTFLTDHPGFSGVVIDTVMSLKNTSATLKLIDGEGNETSHVTYQNSWGADGNGKSLEKIDVWGSDDKSNWGESLVLGGTPGILNSISGQPIPSEPEPETQIEAETETQPQEEEPQPELKPIAYPSNILINEILPSPEGPDEKEEWIEIFNENNFEVNLSNWQITDTLGKTTTFTFPEGTKISPLGFLVLSRPTTKITLNNDGDGLNLIQPDGKIIDSVIYEKAPRGQSYNRTESGWVWSTTLTPGSVNIIPAPEIKEMEPPKEEIEKAAPGEETGEAQPKKELAAIAEQIPKEASSFLPFLIALAIAILSGIIILILKNKLKKFDFLKKIE